MDLTAEISQQLLKLKALLKMAKESPPGQADQNFYQLMVQAKDSLGEASYHMAFFYFEYGHYLLKKMQSNIDLYNEETILNNLQQPYQQKKLENISYNHESDQVKREQLKQFEQPEKQKVEQGNNVDSQAQTHQIIENTNCKQVGLDEVGQQKVDDQDSTDPQICFCNLQMAQQLYETELGKIKSGQSDSNIDEALTGLQGCYTLLGDLHMFEGNFAKSIELYQKIIKQQSEQDHFQPSRVVSQLYYLKGTCYLYQNLTGCESKAISEFIKAASILLSYLNISLGYDISGFDIPSVEKTKVDRFCYMCSVGDNDQVIEIKDALGCLLDKLQETQHQLDLKENYHTETIELSDQIKLNEFKPVNNSEKGRKIVNIGIFCNRKRKPQDQEQILHQLFNKLQLNDPKSFRKEENNPKLANQNSV